MKTPFNNQILPTYILLYRYTHLLIVYVCMYACMYVCMCYMMNSIFYMYIVLHIYIYMYLAHFLYMLYDNYRDPSFEQPQTDQLP